MGDDGRLYAAGETWSPVSRDGMHLCLFGFGEFDLIPDFEPATKKVFDLSIRSWGDLDGDRYADLLHYDVNSDSVYVFWGADEPDTTKQLISPFHSSVVYASLVPDLNGDGSAELVGTDVIELGVQYQIFGLVCRSTASRVQNPIAVFDTTFTGMISNVPIPLHEYKWRFG
ncbi:MAG: hypothetical protein IPH10_11625 [bacterium]|nr:hypothetical protein [bacterium]